MRCKSNGKYPRFAVFENVCGIFSSNKGEDFRAVLESFCKIKDCEIHISRPAKWENAGEILGDNFSVAWRVFDSQHWNVAQRRKRIYLVADFNGTSAGKILFESEGLSRYSAESFKSWQAAAGSVTQGTGTAGKICLNDQGGNRMDVTEEKTCTLRAEAHHPPVVMESAGFCTEHSAKSRSIGYEEEMSPTLRAGVVPAAVCFENHSQDTRYRKLGDIAPTVSANYGMGGNNQPFVVEKTYDVRLTSEGTKNARQNVYETDTARTVDTGGIPPDANQGGIAVVEAYGICSKDSNAMKSDNPNSGFYKAETSRTIDTSDQSPNKNQGGIAVVAIEGNGTRPSHHGNGYSEEGIGYTLNTIEHHGVAYGIDRATYNMGKNAQYAISIQEEVEPTMVAKGPGAVAHPTYCTSKNSYHTRASEELADTLVASDYKDPPTINDTDGEMEYIVRRLTPTECARLQGFPSIVEVNNMTRDELCLVALAAGHIIVNLKTGKVYGRRGPGGMIRKKPVELKGSIVNGYRVYSIHADGEKKQVRANRLVWMAAHGRIPDGMVVDHINNDKLDNRICNLQLLSPEDNSHKAFADGLYLTGDDCPSSKISEKDRISLSFLYWNTNKPFSYYAELFGISRSRAQQIIHEYEWAKNLASDDPTDEEIAKWREIFKEYDEAMGKKTKPKTDNQIRKWLKNPHSDSAEYKMWGNGLSLPISFFVLAGIKWAVDEDIS